MQFELAGAIEVPDGRYLARQETGEQVLVVQTAGAPAPARRRRRRPQQAGAGGDLGPVPVALVTAVRANEPFEQAEAAERWLAETIASEEAVDDAVAGAAALLNRALHARAAAAGDAYGAGFEAERTLRVRVGQGSGKELAAGRFSTAHEVDARGGARRRGREEQLGPQERLAAVLGGRERLDACETLVPRARADLDAGRLREAALQLRVALEALLVELDGALADPGHERDMVELEARRKEAGEAANAALRGNLPVGDERRVGELIAICERVLRRRRVLRG